MDMWQAYLSAAKAKAPNADIVHDKFHIAAHLNEACDQYVVVKASNFTLRESMCSKALDNLALSKKKTLMMHILRPLTSSKN